MQSKLLRSYGRRKSRILSVPKQQALAELLPAISLRIAEGQLIEVADYFPQARAVRLEIGFGAGEHLLAEATREPEMLHIGCEPFLNGIGALLQALEKTPRPNLRLYAGDGREVLAALPPALLDRVWILYPDPWPKVRHHKRRIVNAHTLDLIANALKPGGELELATDDADYAAWMLEHLLADKRFRWTAAQADDWRLPPPYWTRTRYEQKALDAGRMPTYLRFLCTA